MAALAEQRDQPPASHPHDIRPCRNPTRGRGADCSERSSDGEGTRACCLPCRAGLSGLQFAGTGPYMPLSGQCERDRIRSCYLWVMSEAVAVFCTTLGLIAAGHRRSAVQALSPRPASSRRFHRVPCPNPWPPHQAGTFLHCTMRTPRACKMRPRTHCGFQGRLDLHRGLRQGKMYGVSWTGQV